jgi:hypothetical protein
MRGVGDPGRIAPATRLRLLELARGWRALG